MKEPKKKKSGLYYFIIFIVVVVLFNLFVLPRYSDNLSEETDYSRFLEMIEKGEVETVELEGEYIKFTTKDGGEEQTYRTGLIDDPQLVERLQNAKITFMKNVQEDYSPLLTFLLIWILPLILLFFIGRQYSQRMRTGGAGPMTFGKSKAKIYGEKETGVTFDDVAGQDEAKEALKDIIDYLHNPEKYKEIGAKAPKGVLLVGPPGTGKTLLARAVAGESKVPFFSISGSEFVELFVGMGAARVRDLFKQAQEKAPCIVFIDEIDTIGKSRNTRSVAGNDEREQTLNQLLYEMDGFDSGKGVVILAATNRPEILDKALLRPGRFDRRVPLELPDLRGREAILKVHAKKVKTADKIDLTAIARVTPGASGADLANIVNEAALRAVKLNRPYVTQEDLEEAVEVVVAGYERKNAVLSPRDKLRIAYHEVGHAIVAAKQDHTAPVHKITIIPRTSGALGFTMQVEEEEKVLMSKEEALNKITILMAGRAAEEIIFNSITTGAANDIEQATKLARAMVTRYGMSESFDMMALETLNNPYLGDDATLLVSPYTAAKIDEEVLAIIKDCHLKAIQILEENIDKLHEITKYLYEKETISGEEFIDLLTGKKKPEY